MRGQECRGDRGAHRVPNDVRAAQLEMIEQADDVEAHLAAVGAGLMRLAALAVAAGIERDDAVALRQRRKHPGIDPALQAATIAMDQDDRITATLFDVTDADAVGVEKSILGERATSGCQYEAENCQDEADVMSHNGSPACVTVTGRILLDSRT